MENSPQIPIASGYASRAFAESLSEFGEPLHLPECGGYLLKRLIPGAAEFDAMGCYPLFFCRDWSALKQDLDHLSPELVSVGLVADPFGAYTRELLEDCFDVVNPFKKHYIVNLECSEESIGSSHHRKLARKARRSIQVEECKDPEGFLDEWCRLYGHLVKRFDIRGIKAFSRHAFLQQLRMPEIVVHQAFRNGELIGAQLFFVQDGVAQCYLGAVCEEGYRHGAFYALDAFSFEFFRGKARRIDLGGGAGLATDAHDGLSRYKRGWCTETRPVYFCGRIINPAAYQRLAGAADPNDSVYFPAYRAGELG